MGYRQHWVAPIEARWVLKIEGTELPFETLGEAMDARNSHGFGDVIPANKGAK